MGKASFIDADILMTDTHITDIVDDEGKSTGHRMISHYKLDTHKPRSGTRGWELFVSSAGQTHFHGKAVLECSYCGHLYIIRINPYSEMKSSNQLTGKPMGTPASYTSDWFSYTQEEFSGEPSLSCVHCEQKSLPRVEFLTL